MFTRRAKVGSDLAHFGSAKVAVHDHRDRERLIVFSKTLKRGGFGGNNYVTEVGRRH